tara:strand:+ start:949 stop:1305 length:357 start_codon:yes stop_codon:yes gene_type:complete
VDFTKRKYIEGQVFTAVHSKKPYVVVYDWGVIRFNTNKISEIEQYDSPFFYYTMKQTSNGSQDYDFVSLESFCCFAFGRKLLLTERAEGLHEKTTKSMNLIRLEKVTMSNGNSYITIV